MHTFNNGATGMLFLLILSLIYFREVQVLFVICLNVFNSCQNLFTLIQDLFSFLRGGKGGRGCKNIIHCVFF